eukprot:237045-Prorocentrum_minimum.AAC.3
MSSGRQVLGSSFTSKSATSSADVPPTTVTLGTRVSARAAFVAAANASSKLPSAARTSPSTFTTQHVRPSIIPSDFGSNAAPAPHELPPKHFSSACVRAAAKSSPPLPSY